MKKEVLDGRLHCTVEHGIRLAGLAVQGNAHMHAQTSHVNNQPEGDRHHKREKVCTNSYFLRSSWLHYLIWLHTTGRAQSTWVPMVSVFTHTDTHSLTPSSRCCSCLLSVSQGECKQTVCLSLAPRLTITASGRRLSVERQGSCTTPQFEWQTAQRYLGCTYRRYLKDWLCCGIGVHVGTLFLWFWRQ